MRHPRAVCDGWCGGYIVRRHPDDRFAGSDHVRVDGHPYVYHAGYAWRPSCQDRCRCS
jgi:hypothetical protein